MKRQFVLNTVAVLLVLPLWAWAAGLVPCGGNSEEMCQTCHVMDLISGLLNWLIAILTVVAAILFTTAGLKLVTSAGNTSAMSEAKRIISNTFIGFVIVLAAWLLVDFGMKSLVGGNFNNQYGPWNEIQCLSQPEAQYVNTYSSVGLVNGAYLDTPCGAAGCDDLIKACESGGGKPTEKTDSSGQKIVSCYYDPNSSGGGTGGGGVIGVGGKCAVPATGNPCNPSNQNMINAFGSRVQEASIICNKESGGQPVLSGADRCCGNDASCSNAQSFSGGYFQINIFAHYDKIPGCNLSGQTKGSCLPGQYKDKNGDGKFDDGSEICTGWSCSFSNQAMYDTCIQATKNADLNFAIAKKLYDGRGGHFNDWAWSARRCNIPM